MKVRIVKTKEEMGQVAAMLIAEDMARKTPYILGLATGSTPIPLYQALIKLYRARKLDFSTTISFNLDEYVGLKPTHDQSYRYFMNQQLFDHININKKNTFVPDGMAKDIDAHCAKYEAMIKSVGGIDCQVLGIGSNGHIGFNEPGSSIGSLTRMVNLTANTIKDNSRFFKRVQDVPTKAISMGIGTVLRCKKIVLVASGANKTDCIAKAVEGPITATVPASALQLHPGVTFVITEDAAAGLKLEW